MYAVVSSGGKQYRVEAGSELIVERIAGEPGASVTFDRVLLIGDGDDVTVGTPTVSGASVSGTLLGEELGPKLVIFKFKQKVKYRRRTGHRQHLVRVRIDEINASGKRSSRAAEPKADAKPAEPKDAATAEAAAPAEKPTRKPRAASAKASKESKASASVKSKPVESKPSEAKATETEKPKRKARAKAAADKPAEE